MNVLFGIIVIITGILNLTLPEVMAELSMWRYKNTEPSDAYIEMKKVGGVIAIVVGLFAIFIY